MRHFWRYFLFLIGLLAVTTWIAVIIYPDRNLHIVACNVGQGDAILAYYGKTQVLIDGGPNNKVLDCLSKYMPFWDRKIEVVVLSHPQKDHFMGLIEVFKRYEVDYFMANTLDSGSIEYGVLKRTVGGKGVRVVNPQSGMNIGVGLMRLDVVWPSKEFLSANLDEVRITGDTLLQPIPQAISGVVVQDEQTVLGAKTSKTDPNDFSIVSIISYGEFDAVMTGDVGPSISDDLMKQLGSLLSNRSIEYLKVPHHGSKNGLTSELLDASDPSIAVISVGKNQWGHPHGEVLQMLDERNIKILRTDNVGNTGVSGDVEVVSDGDNWWLVD